MAGKKHIRQSGSSMEGMFQLLKRIAAKSPRYLIRCVCLLAFLVQTTTLIAGMVSPKDTVIKTQKIDLAEIDFPLIFKVCVKPGFNETQLKILGYRNSHDYLVGTSKYNKTVFGWAGHTPDGNIVSNISGNMKLHI